MRETLEQVLSDLRECAGQLRRFQKFAEAKRIDEIANKLDQNVIKPSPIVYRSISG